MTTRLSIHPFEDFRKSLSSTTYSEARERNALRTDNEGFDELREFLLDRYDGVEVRHSFLEPGGEVVDCIPVEQQRSVRDGGDVPVAPAAPPPAPDDGRYAESGPVEYLPPQLDPDHHDVLGNVMWCPPGTVPVLRHTLDRLAAEHTSLDDFLRGPSSADRERRHAVGKQVGDNLGGYSNINVWQPLLMPPTLLSSASQQWYSNGELPFVDWQSVECGWRAGVIVRGAPTDSLPRLFVFYARKGYTAGNCGYNDYVPGTFGYATGATHVLHTNLSPVSQQGGDQFEIRMGFTFIDGAWWLHVGGAWIGRYPAALFGTGTLRTHAHVASFGGETTTGFSWFPTMGSGRFPSEGFGRAAYQRFVAVNDMSGVPRHAQLTPGPVSSRCYNVAVDNNPADPWGTHLYFGGPGGLNCP